MIAKYCEKKKKKIRVELSKMIIVDGLSFFFFLYDCVPRILGID
jgi:hypothetical protein